MPNVKMSGAKCEDWQKLAGMPTGGCVFVRVFMYLRTCEFVCERVSRCICVYLCVCDVPK